jgi:PucR family transcriptional regulator, purine catabolism regulatory protein
MQLADALTTEPLQRARVVAGHAGIDRRIRWIHVVDLPDPSRWVRPGMLLLATGYAWPRDADAQRALIRDLAQCEIAAVGLAVPQFFERFPAVMCEEADRLALPLLEIPWEIPFAQIGEQLLQALVVQQYRQLERSEAIHRALTQAAVEAESLQDIVAALGQLIDRAVTFEDADGQILAAHRHPTMEDDLRRATLELGRTPPAYEALLAAVGLPQAISAAAGAIRVPPFPEIGATGRVVCPIRLRREVVGRAWIIEGARPLSDLDLRAAEQAALIAALHILHQREIELRESRLGGALLSSLLDTRVALTPQTLERARMIGLDLQRPYHVAMLLLHGASPPTPASLERRDRVVAAIRKHLHPLGTDLLMLLSGAQMTALIPAGEEPLALWDAVAAEDLSMAYSRPYAGVAGLQRGAAELAAIVSILRPGEVASYEQLQLPRVLAGDRQAQIEFVDLCFGPIQRARGGEALAASLRAYVAHGFHLGRTAKALFIHPKTLSYRLARCADLAALDLADPQVRFRLQLAHELLSQHLLP